MPLADYAGAIAFAPTRALFRGVIRMGSCPKDPEVGDAAPVGAPSDLSSAYKGRMALVVGGTRGIGAAIAQTLREAGAAVTIVGRSAAPGVVGGAFAADLSTVKGCRQLVADMVEAGVSGYDYLIFTVGAWPDFTDWATADGVEKVVALDLLARHVVLEQLVAAGLLRSGARVLNVLASSQQVPLVTAAGIKQRVAASGPPANMAQALLPVGIAADAWLQDAARRHDSLTLIGMFPGILPTELPGCTFPRWSLPLLTAAMLPVASSAAQTGLAGATILAAPNVRARGASFFNHLLEARRAHALAYDTELGAWITDFLDRAAAARGTPGVGAVTSTRT